PRHGGQGRRGEQPGPREGTAPDPGGATTTPDDADAAAAGAGSDRRREGDGRRENRGATPGAERRSGGRGG
ncbi:hypothetical protein, partial [Mycobacterium tuberculosis]|uniref:hypothetical protein n=1 Tax=Mycobacterium tuberculosis TaxID=1773 RepID=UPI000E3709E4